jgi:hypothetical protein
MVARLEKSVAIQRATIDSSSTWRLKFYYVVSRWMTNMVRTRQELEKKRIGFLLLWKNESADIYIEAVCEAVLKSDWSVCKSTTRVFAFSQGEMTITVNMFTNVRKNSALLKHKLGRNFTWRQTLAHNCRRPSRRTSLQSGKHAFEHLIVPDSRIYQS